MVHTSYTPEPGSVPRQPSYAENGSGYLLETRDMVWFWDHYLPNADEFPKGKYEVEDAWKYYGTLRTTPEMEKDVRETAIALLRGLRA